MTTDNVYFVYNNTTGDIRSLSTIDPTTNLNLIESCVVVSDEYLELYRDFLSFKKKMTNYKIDTNSSALKVIDKFSIQTNPDYNSFYSVPFVKLSSANAVEIVLRIVSIDNVPHLILRHNGTKKDLIDKKESFLTVYATKKDDINVLYESFKFNFEELDDNGEFSIRINKIDFDALYNSDISFYTRKIFKTYGCTFE
jgi:hypothetical protein